MGEASGNSSQERLHENARHIMSARLVESGTGSGAPGNLETQMTASADQLTHHVNIELRSKNGGGEQLKYPASKESNN